MSKGNGRQATVTLKKENKKKNLALTKYIENFSFTDVATGSSDSISVNLNNLDKEFLNKWLPKKGMTLIPTINLTNWNKDGQNKSVKCGKFILDDFSLSGRPLVATIQAVSSPANSAFTTKQRTKTWKSITIKRIAKTIAKRYKLTLVYDAPTVKIKSIEQNNAADSSFLSDLCSDYALAMKIFAKKLVIYGEAKYEKKKAIKTIKESMMSEWSYETSITGTYTGCKYSYTDPKTNKTVKVKVGKGSRWLSTNGEAGSKADARKKAYAAVNNSNKEMSVLSFSLPADPALVASSNIKVTGLGKLNGKYFITEVTHKISTNSGYEMSIKARKIQQRLPKKKGSK